MRRYLIWSIMGCFVALLFSGLMLSERFAISDSDAVISHNVGLAATDSKAQIPQSIEFKVLNGDTSTITLECFDANQLGFMDLEGNLIVPQCFTTAYPFHEGLALVGFMESPGLEHFGFINDQAEFVFPPTILKPQFIDQDLGTSEAHIDDDQGRRFSEGHFPLRRLPDNKIGFINYVGEFVIEPQFDVVGGFHEGVSLVCEIVEPTETEVSPRRCGYLCPNGELVVPFEFAGATSFHNGIAPVRYPGEKGWTLINNKTFKPLSPNVLRSVGESSGTVPASGQGFDHTWHVDSGLVNVSLPGCRYATDEEYPFMGAEPPEAPPLPADEYGEEGYEYWNPGPMTWGYINVKEGGFAIEPRFCNQISVDEGFFSGRAVVRIHRDDPDPSIPDRWKGRQAMIDTTGKVVDNFGDDYIPDSLGGWYEAAEDFLQASISQQLPREEERLPDGRMWLPPTPSEGFIDRDGRWAIPPQFGKANNFKEGLALVQDPETRKYGYIDTEGNYVIPPRFEGFLNDFSQGLALVQLSINPIQIGFINRQGEWAIPPQSIGAESFHSSGFTSIGYADGRKALIDKQGDYVFPPTEDVSFEELERQLTLVNKKTDSAESVSFIINAAGRVLPYTVASLDNSLEANLIIVGKELPESFIP